MLEWVWVNILICIILSCSSYLLYCALLTCIRIGILGKKGFCKLAAKIKPKGGG